MIEINKEENQEALGEANEETVKTSNNPEKEEIKGKSIEIFSRDWKSKKKIWKRN